MEGERILCVLRSEGSVSGIHGLLKDVKNYLGPVLSAAKTKAAKPKDTSQFGKYELFSLKLLKQCIEQSKKVKQCDAPGLLKVGSVSVDCLEICTNCSKRVPPLSFEKLLFHFASQCFNCADYATGLKSCQVLHTQLLSEKMNVTELKKEGSTLLKHAFELLWKAALKIEQKSSQNGAAFESSDVETCLELRRNAFLCLTSTDFDLDFVLDRILKTDLRYQKLSTVSNQTDPTHNPFKRLYSFHVSLLQHKDLCSLFHARTPCKTFTAGVDYLLHLAKVCMNSSNLKECATFISRAQILCQEHMEVCRENGHHACAIQAQVMSLLATIRDLDVCTAPNHSEVNFSEETLQVLEGIASDLRVHTSSIDVVFVPRLTDSLEMLVSALEDKRSEFQRRLSVQREKSFIPKQVFLPLQEIVNCYTECIESQLQEQLKSAQPDKTSTLELNTRSHQLSMLAFMAQVLLDLLLARDDIECDEIEIMRSSASSKISMQAPPHPRKELADLCIPVLQTSQGVIQKAPSGLLPSAEHKWLGNNAYNLGLALFRSELYREAASVLELACRELSVWCGEGGGEREKMKRSEESQLLKKFTLLIDCYRQSACYTDTLEAVELAITSLPTNQIASTACASVLASQWVKAKRDIAATGTFSAHELSQRTTLQVLEREGRVSLEVKVLFLEEELKMYKTQSHNTQPDQLAVAKLLLDLYTSEEDDSKVVDRARAMVEMAAIMRECDDDSYSSLPLLDDALSLLEPLTSSHPPPHCCQVYEQLAVTHLWKAICTQEQMINSTSQNSIPAATDTTKADPTDKTDTTKADFTDKTDQLCLSSLQEQSMQCDDVGQCLHSAVESWGALWGVVREKGVGKSKSNECFHDVSVTFQYLHLTTSLCLALMKPLLALKTLGTLINIYEWAPLPDLTVPYQNALAQHCELVLSLTGGGPSSKVESTEATCDDTSVRGKTVLEQQASHLSCQLALARLRLERGQFDECRRLLVGAFESPVLSRHSTLSYTLTARAKLLASLYLQHRQFDIKPSEEFLQYMLNETHQPFEEMPFKLTAHELAMDAVKIYRSLASKHNVVSERNQACNKEDVCFDGNEGFIDSETTDSFVEAHATEMTVSPSVTAWDTLSGLMMSLKTVAEMWLQQGGVREAYFYAREGMSLANSVLLHGWYVEFLLLLAHVQETRGQSDSSRTLLLQTGRLLELDHYLTLPQDAPRHSTPPPSPLGQSEGSSGHSSDESLLEELASLKITTCTRKTQKTSLSLHPDSCMCCTCTNHTHLLQTATALELWAALEIKDDVSRALGSLSTTLEFVRGGVKKCDNALALVHPANVPRKSKRSRKKGAQPQSVLSITDSTAYISLILQLQTHQSQAHLQLNSPEKSLGVCREALSAIQSTGILTSGPAISHALAELHYTMGEACLGEMDSQHPGVTEMLWESFRDCGKNFLSSGVIPDVISRALSNFLMSYQYCYPTVPSLLLRDICLWLCVCLSPFHTELASHYLLLSTQMTLSHQAVYAIGKKIRKNQSSDSDSPHYDVVQTLSPLSPRHHNPDAIQRARSTLQLHPTPTTLSYTRSLIQTLPTDWSICSISLAPKTQQGKQYLIVLQIKKQKSPFLVKIPLRSTSELEEFNDIHAASVDSMAIGEKRVWWNTRRKLDKQMQEILCRLETSWLGHWRTLLRSGSCDSEVAKLAAEVREELDWFGVSVSVRCAEMLVEGGRSIDSEEMVSMVEEIGQGKLTRPQCEQISVHVTAAIPCLKRYIPCPVILVLGRSLHCLPWESLPVLSHQSVSRMPSLAFTIAHKQHLSHNGNTTIDPCKTFYVVNPRNDLPNTEKVFSKWFSSERGWKGVVGRAPTEEEYTSALEDHDLFVYCGHGTGREYLHTDVFQQLECQATTLLMGCSSGQLAVGGRCDPTGMALNYLITGCPALVANLWDVTDGDIDRFCQALLKSWLGHSSELSLASYVADARSVCKLQRLIGASPVVYGIPVVARRQ